MVVTSQTFDLLRCCLSETFGSGLEKRRSTFCSAVSCFSLSWPRSLEVGCHCMSLCDPCIPWCFVTHYPAVPSSRVLIPLDRWRSAISGNCLSYCALTHMKLSAVLVVSLTSTLALAVCPTQPAPGPVQTAWGQCGGTYMYLIASSVFHQR